MVLAARRDSEPDSRSDDERSSAGFNDDSSDENASEGSSQIAVDEKIPMSPGQAAAIIQGYVVPNECSESDGLVGTQ